MIFLSVLNIKLRYQRIIKPCFHDVFTQNSSRKAYHPPIICKTDSLMCVKATANRTLLNRTGPVGCLFKGLAVCCKGHGRTALQQHGRTHQVFGHLEFCCRQHDGCIQVLLHVSSHLHSLADLLLQTTVYALTQCGCWWTMQKQSNRLAHEWTHMQGLVQCTPLFTISCIVYTKHQR